MNRRGAVLILTFMIMIALISITIYFLYMTSMQARGSGIDVKSHKALWVAEAGIQKYVYFLKYEQDYREDYPDLTESFGSGSYSVTVSYDEPTSIYTITSIGTVGGVSRKVRQGFEVTSAILQRAIHADGAHLKLNGSSGTIDGNVSCFTSVLPDPVPAGLTITGTVTDGADQPKINPAMDSTVYYNLADDLDQASTDNLTFASGNTYSGIWYTTKKVTIESNATINGTIYAEGNIDFERGAEDIVINPRAYDPDENYPALVSESNITAQATTGKTKIGLQDCTISGLVMGGNNIIFERVQGSTSFTGTLVAGNNLELENGNLDVTYDETIFTPMPPGFTFEGEAEVTPQKDWNEIVPAS